MVNRKVLIDTSIIIDFLRKKKKEDSFLWKIKEINLCFMSSITLFEIFSGAKTERHFEHIKKLTKWIKSIYFDDEIAEDAASIFQSLKSMNKIIEYRDIFIAATAISHNFCLATLNTNHFERIEHLMLFDLHFTN